MTYDESAALMKDPAFIGRVKVACLGYATYIFDEPVTTPAHNSRLRWAQNTMIQPDSVAQGVTPPTVMDTAVQDAGPAIEDAALQSAVENTVNKLL